MNDNTTVLHIDWNMEKLTKSIDGMTKSIDGVTSTLAAWQVNYLQKLVVSAASKKFLLGGESWHVTGSFSGGLAIEGSHDATPRPVSRDELLASMEKIVTAVGTNYVATSHATNSVGADGRRCIQGELMVDLGFEKNHAYLPGGYSGVHELFCLGQDDVAYGVLEKAERMNDTGKTWGEILDMAKATFAKAA